MKNLVLCPCELLNDLKQAKLTVNFETITYQKNNNLTLLVRTNKVKFERVFIIGAGLHQLFLQLSKLKTYVVTFAFSFCDAVEPALFSDANIYLFDFLETGKQRIFYLLNEAINQPKRNLDGYHDQYVKQLMNRGKDEK